MKKTANSGLLFLFSSAVIFNATLNAQKSIDKSGSMENIKTWYESRVWANGLNLKAHPSVDIQEFYDQYHRNKKYWDEAFEFLKNDRLDTIAPGKYNLDGNNVYAIVSDGPTKAIGDAKWENHRNYIDVQYVIRGKEKMGIAPLAKARVLEEYDASKDIAFNDVPEKECLYYIAVPGTFLIFFPRDAHRPSIKVEGFDTVKKVVIKILAAAK